MAANPTFFATGHVVTDAEIRAIVVLDDDEDADVVLAGVRFQTCAGYWEREKDGRWRWWQDVEWKT